MKSSSFGKAGVCIGLACFATLLAIDVFGPETYSSSGSGMLMADGTLVVTRSDRPILPMIAQTAFFTFLLPLVLGAIAVFRKERIGMALGAFCLGLAPLPIYTLGVVMSTALYIVLWLPALAVYAGRRVAEKRRRDDDAAQ